VEGSYIAIVEGSTHDDTLRGNSQSNTLIGGDGADILDGRGGSDELVGGGGADTSIIGLEEGDVTIQDFDTGTVHDQLNLASFPSITSMSDLRERMTSGSVIIDIDRTHRVRILYRTPQEMLNPKYFLLWTPEGDDASDEAGDDECGWFSYAKPECVDTILSIVGGIVFVAGLFLGAWQFLVKCVWKSSAPAETEEEQVKVEARKRSISDTRDSRARSSLATKSERKVDRDVTDIAREEQHDVGPSHVTLYESKQKADSSTRIHVSKHVF